MRRASVALILSMAMSLPVAPAVAADIPPEQLPAQIRQAIERGVAFLRRKQRPDGTWTEPVGYHGGVTSLATLALLNAGVPPEDPAIQRALDVLRRQTPRDINFTYSVALQVMVLCRVGQQRDELLIRQGVQWLEAAQTQAGEGKGGWSYSGGGMGADNSNAQFALLALYEAERVGVRASERTWQLAKNYWEEGQNSDGSWGYQKGSPARGSMTCAGITSLVIIYDVVRPANARVEGERIDCCRPVEARDDRIQRALEWLAVNFSVTHNPGYGRNLLYYLYGLERVGRLTNRRFIGRHDWYREGAASLVGLKSSGPADAALAADYWVGVGTGEGEPTVGTSFALLFLAKGRRPVLLAKLKHGAESDWNAHTSDVHNLTLYVESKWKMDLGWQTVDLSAATVDDLVQSPVVYLNGSNTPLPADEEARRDLARKLRDYLDRGGFVLAEASCPAGTFDAGFKDLVKRIFPEPEYALRLLPPEHPIWRQEEVLPPDLLRPLWGIEFGCRTSVVYAPPYPTEQPGPSLSCLWELGRTGRQQKYAPAAERQVAVGLAIGNNILAYASNKQPQHKENLFAQPDKPPPLAGTGRGVLAVASVRHAGGCTAAPRAWTNLLDRASSELGLRTDPAVRELVLTDEAVFDYPLLFMHGRNRFQFTPGERAQLRTYLERGGALLADAICAGPGFVESFRQEMRLVLAEHPLERIPPDDPLLSTKYGGSDLSTVERRDPQPTRPGEPLSDVVRKGPPELEGIRRLGDRWAVVFSPIDLSCALEKHDSRECRGYVQADAARIGLNVILYALQQ